MFGGSEGEDGDFFAAMVSSTTADGMAEMLDLRVKKLVSLRWGGEKESEEKIQKVGSSA